MEGGGLDDVAVVYRGTSLTRNTPLLGPYSTTTPRVIWWSQGGGMFLMNDVPLYPGVFMFSDPGTNSRNVVTAKSYREQEISRSLSTFYRRVQGWIKLFCSVGLSVQASSGCESRPA